MSKITTGFSWSSKLGIALIALVTFVVLYFVAPLFMSTSYQAKVLGTVANGESAQEEEIPAPVHVETPNELKAFYMSACVAATPSWRERMAELVNDTELNSIMIDIKDYSGTISFIDPKLQGDDVTGCRAKDMKEYVERLHKDNIYVIGRVTVFQDPYYAKRHPELAVKSKATGGTWKDKHGLPFVDVGAKPYWDHVIDIAKASYALGFDEINFDYIRYPSDGNMSDAKYTWTTEGSTKADMVESFFSYLHSQLKDTGMKTSADLFGLVTVAYDDLGIGQVLEKALPYFDYIYPMVYPSHFAPGSGGFSKPAQSPYGIIKYSMSGGIAKEQAWNVANGRATSTPSKLRPWLQDFDLGATYGVAEVQAQIQATYDVGLNGWLLWDAGNKYTPAALKAE